MGTESRSVTFAGEEFELLPEKAVFWPRERALLVADVHLGKAETFQRAGVPIPTAIHDADLDRLTALVKRTTARQLYVLGDLFHHGTGLTADLLCRVDLWLQRLPAVVTLVGGNHDKPLLSKLAQLKLTVVAEPFALGPILLTHEGNGTGPRWSGHQHPVARLNQGGESFRLPCFWFQEDLAVLPAFGEFTGGHPIQAHTGDRVFVVADQHVLEI